MLQLPLQSSLSTKHGLLLYELSTYGATAPGTGLVLVQSKTHRAQKRDYQILTTNYFTLQTHCYWATLTGDVDAA